MAKKYVVELTDEERNQLLALLKKGKVAARKLCRAQILLLADEGASDALIATTLHMGVATVERTRKRFVEEGLAAALTDLIIMSIGLYGVFLAIQNVRHRDYFIMPTA